MGLWFKAQFGQGSQHRSSELILVRTEVICAFKWGFKRIRLVSLERTNTTTKSEQEHSIKSCFQESLWITFMFKVIKLLECFLESGLNAKNTRFRLSADFTEIRHHLLQAAFYSLIHWYTRREDEDYTGKHLNALWSLGISCNLQSLPLKWTSCHSCPGL